MRSPSGALSRIVLPIAGVVVLIAFWQLAGTTQLLGRSVPPPTEVLAALAERGDVLWRATLATSQRALVGGLIGYAIGLVLASITAWFPRSTTPLVRTTVLINAIPIVAIGPVLMTGAARPFIPEIFAALSVLFSTTLATSDGFRTVSRAGRDVFRVFGATRLQRFVRLEAPSALPMAADALRLAVPAAILGAILGEWFGAERGLGVVMVSSMRNVQYGQLWAAALITVLVSVVFYALATLLEKSATRRFGRTGETPSAVPALSRGLATVIGIAIPLALVVAWQLWVLLGRVPLIVAPQPLQVVAALGDGALDLLAAAGLTTLSALGGLLCGALVGLALAVVVTLVPWLASMLSPLALVIPTVPIVVFIPVIGGMLGYGMQTVFASCVLMAFFPLYVLALSGLRARPLGSDDLFSVYGAGRVKRLVRLALPASVPSLLVAIRLAAANCFLIALSAEWLMGEGGLGRVFSERRVMLDTAGSWAAVAVAIVLSVLAYAGAALLEKKLLARWGA
ncbi:ABC transporter permease subunit [Herbiconiux moechotypicola]|uniref:ABC transmembrane type-1 domain-containing protein n=1 Tax=Herbiconiux moechotypicola TaxID=637393 RepID=A0ABN3DQX4_9MICO|nr:ABC transporter permease subunit [Herbiconiux moechotypicola]MCS5731434.1 ABC transporter permease subunit [Herbiconiux moechotypicola]